MKTLLLLILLFLPSCAVAMTDSEAVNIIIGEAANQNFIGMVMVGEVIRHNPTAKYYGKNAKHIHNETKAIWVQATSAWAESAYTDYTKGATHFDSSDFKKPKWARDMIVTTMYGKHTFYKENYK